MTGGRMRRVDEAMREVLSGAITSELKDPRVGFTTVTSVDTAPDLRHARVYVSVLGSGSVQRRSLDGLRSAHGFLQRRVADELHIKHTPALDFVYDGQIASLRRMQDDVREVAAGFECGIVLQNFSDIKEGDQLEVYETRQVERTLS